MPKILLGFLFIIFAAVSFWDGYRITTTLRRPGVYDSLGPDRYLIAIAVVILVLGIALAIQGFLEFRRPAQKGEEDTGTRRHLWLFAAICGYSGLIWFLGYAAATLLFFIAALWIMGHRDWRWNLASSVALTTAFFLMFEYAADISLPKGFFG